MKRKKSISLTLAVLIAFLYSTLSVFAQEPPTQELMNTSLIARGYPQIVVDEMTAAVKQSIYEDESLYFKGAVITAYDPANDFFINYKISTDSIVPVEQVSTNPLSFAWIISGDQNNPNSIDIKYSYQWKTLPFFRWQDPITISWNSDLFEMTDDSFHKVDSFDGVLVNTATGKIIQQYKGEVHAEEYGYAVGGSSGVKWYADLKGYTPIIVTQLYGYGEFELEKKTSSSGSGRLYGHYVHPTVSTSLSISIAGIGDFSVSGSSGYDERGNQTTFIY